MKKFQRELMKALQKQLKPASIYICGVCGWDVRFWTQKELIDHILKDHKIKEVLDYVK